MDLSNKNEDYSMDNSKTIYIFCTILAGFLTLFPTGSATSFYILKLLGFIIYFFVLKKITKTKIVIAVLAIIFLLLNFLSYNDISNLGHVGLGDLGSALGRLVIFRIFLYMYYLLTVILFILYARKFLFKKQVLIPIIVIGITITLLVFIYKLIYSKLQTKEVKNNISNTISLKKELDERKLYNEDYLLFGVDNEGKNIHRIYFNSNANEKYPLYIYYGYKTLNTNKIINPNDEYLNWIIYYTDDKIYAALADYYKTGYPDSYVIYGSILGEQNNFYLYDNNNNVFEKINTNKENIYFDYLFYKSEDMYISMALIKKATSQYLYKQYEVLDSINSNTLDSYANKLTSKNHY